MKKTSLKRFMAGALIGAMALSGSAAMAIDTNTKVSDWTVQTDQQDAPILTFPDSVTKTTKATKKAANYATKNVDKSLERVKNLTAVWIYAGKGILCMDWDAVEADNLKNYEIELSTSKKFARKKSEYFTSKMDRATLDYEDSRVFNIKKHKTYYIRVRANYTDGKKGSWSKTLKLVTTKKTMIS